MRTVALVVTVLVALAASTAAQTDAPCDNVLPMIAQATGPPAAAMPGNDVTIPGSFPGNMALCSFFSSGDFVATTPGTVSASNDEVACQVPRAFVASRGRPIAECSLIDVVVRNWHDSATMKTAKPQGDGCSTDRGQHSMQALDAFEGTSRWRFRMAFDPAQPCDGTVPSGSPCSAVQIEQPATAPMAVDTGDVVYVKPMPGTSFGEHSFCTFWSADGRFSSEVPATRSDPDQVGCVVPRPPPSGGSFACGDNVFVTVNSYSPGEDPVAPECYSTLGGDATFSGGGAVFTAGGSDVPHAALVLVFACGGTETVCTTVPQINGASPTAGVAPGDIVTITSPSPDTFSADNARCLWWYDGVAYRLYQTAVSQTSGSIECEVPSRQITYGPDAGTTIPPCAAVRVTVQTWPNSVTNEQANTCFSHEGQTEPNWAVTDYAEVTYSCENDGDSDSDCLMGPFDMTWYQGNILVANEGRGGGGTSLSHVAGPGTMFEGEITSPWLQTVDPTDPSAGTLNGPSGVTWLSMGSELLISDDYNGGRLLLHDVATGMTDITFLESVPGSPVPGSNPNAVRVNAAGDIFVAFAAGFIGRYYVDSTSGNWAYCDLATGVNTPQAVEIFDAENKVWFTDMSMNLFEVDDVCPGTSPAPATAPVCASASDCNAVPLGGSGTQGGLIKAGDKFYVSDYDGHEVLVYDRAASTVTTCVSGVSQARGLLVDTNHIYITSYDTDSIWRAQLDCTNLELFADGECPELPEGESMSDDYGTCEADLFYYKGLVLTNACESPCNPNFPAITWTKPDGTVEKYYSLGKAEDKNLKRCFTAPATI